jgi:hypothetical protein
MNRIWFAVIPVVLGAWGAAVAAEPELRSRPSGPASRPSTWAITQSPELIAPPLEAPAAPPVSAPPLRAPATLPEAAPPPAPAAVPGPSGAPAPASPCGCCGAGGCGTGAPPGASGQHRLLAWLTYCPITGVCGHVCACPQPPLYTYFLCFPCRQGYCPAGPTCPCAHCPTCGQGFWRNLFAFGQ